MSSSSRLSELKESTFTLLPSNASLPSLTPIWTCRAILIANTQFPTVFRTKPSVQRRLPVGQLPRKRTLSVLRMLESQLIVVSADAEIVQNWDTVLCVLSGPFPSITSKVFSNFASKLTLILEVLP